MRQDIAFDADGVTLRGWLYLPDDSFEPAPIVVMAHDFAAVKEMYLDWFAERFAQTGLAVLVFDHRNTGASDGEPRHEIDPRAQIRDYRHAITYATTLDVTDRERIGVWGCGYAGGHVLVVGAIDRRVTCVVAQTPFVSGHETFRALTRSGETAAIRTQFDEDRTGRFAGKAPQMVPVVSDNPVRLAALPTADAHAWFTRTKTRRARSWRNEVTLRSVEMLTEYEPGAYLPRVSPTPLLMIVAHDDHVMPSALATAAYALANEPKRLEVLPGGHFDLYAGGFPDASRLACDWFAEHLLRRGGGRSTR